MDTEKAVRNLLILIASRGYRASKVGEFEAALADVTLDGEAAQIVADVNQVQRELMDDMPLP